MGYLVGAVQKDPGENALLIQHSTREVAEAFCASRLADSRPHLYGTLPLESDCMAIINRTLPD